MGNSYECLIFKKVFVKDRLGNEIRTGEIVKIVGSYDIPMFNYWIIVGYLDYGTTIEVILQHYNSKEIKFISILDIERPFGD